MTKKKQASVGSSVSSREKAKALSVSAKKSAKKSSQKSADKSGKKTSGQIAVGEQGFGGGSVLNRFKWLLVIALGVMSVFGNVRFQYYPLAERLIALIALGLVMIGLALSTTMGKKFARFVVGARAEMRRVVWPSRQEVTQTTMIVVIVVIITSLILWAVDGLFGHVIKSLIM